MRSAAGAVIKGQRWGLYLGFLALSASVLLQLSIWPSFEVQRRAIRSEMKWKLLRGVPENDLLTFRFTAKELAELDFEDGGKEVVIGGAMHDIVRRTTEAGGIVVLHVIRDEAETALLAGLDRKVRGVQEHDERGQQQRRALVSMWPGFHENARPDMIFRRPTDRIFPEMVEAAGRAPGAVDPGPPRRV